MKLMRFARWMPAGFALLGVATAFGQTIGIQRRGQPDLFDMMVASGASFDMDSPVEAHAEFDPPVAAPGGRVIYRITASALDESLEIPGTFPTPDGLELHAGGRGQTYVPTNERKVRPETAIIFHAIAPTNGSFTIPAFQAMAYGKPIQIPAATLRVAPDGLSAPQVPALLMNPPDDDVYVGETFSLPLAIPNAHDNSVLGMSEPHIKGDFIFAEELPAMVRQDNIQLEGRTLTAFVCDVTITPLREGPRELIGQAWCAGLRPVPGQTNASRISNVLVDSAPMTVIVHPLPEEGRLPGFTGGVGQFTLDPPRLSAGSVRAGEPVVLTVTIRSAGEIGRVPPPPQPDVRGWQSFPPAPENPPSDYPQQRNFESFNYTFIPMSADFKATPAIPFSYFDPGKKIYVDLTIPPVPLTVDPAPVSTAQAPLPPIASRPGTDDSTPVEKELVLAGLSTAPGLAVSTLVPLQQHWWFFAIQLVPAAALGGLWAWDRRRRHLREHPEILRKRRARRGMRRQLRLAQRAAAARDAAGFARGAAEALREACAPHGAADPAALVCADVLQELPATEQQGRAGEMVRRLFAAAD
ncbi:MAG TPA: hypothetical protein VN048_06830, partial [Verrucomicrobiae bacterium]|nr:hypothetical protein [Verrucomicrobiae bacterium]